MLDRPRRGAVARAAASEATYAVGDGEFVHVRVSDVYSNPDDAARQLVTLLGSLAHGEELSRLTVFLATPRQLRGYCGAGALACYSPFDEEMVVAGDDSPGNQPPRELVIAHEYGHHVARNRRNKPWNALARGTKRWSTHERICRGITRGTIRPSRYYENPGEAFAEAYAFNRFPRAIAWEWDIARPNRRAFDAIDEDVLSPWTRRMSRGWSGRLDRNERRWASVLRTPLDGRLKVQLDGPSGADLDLVLRARRGGEALRRSTGPGADERLGYTVCGRRAVRVEVRRRSGGGPFEVTTARP